MDYEQIKDLIKIIEASKLTEFEMSMNGATVKMKKAGADGGDLSGAKVKQSIQAAGDAYAPVTIIPEDAAAKIEGQIVTSPIVGTFYTAATPNASDFVTVGQKVAVGDVLCIIEAMKIMNEITSDYNGQVAEVYVENGEMVEYGQPLYRIV